MPTSRFSLRVLALISLLSCLAWGAAAYSQQGSGSSRSDPSRSNRPQTLAEFCDSFWRFLVRKEAAYNTWKVLDHDPPTDVENPHGPVAKTYANSVAAADPANLPNGSILVREDFDDKRKRLSISVLYRVKDFDKEHGNWYAFRFTETGQVVKGADNKPLAGKVASCVECHAKAAGKDFIFANDTFQSAPPVPPATDDKPAKEADKQPAKEKE